MFVCKFVIDFGIHVGLGCLWSSMLYGKGYYYFFMKSLIKNAIMFPIEVFMLVTLLQIFLPVLACWIHPESLLRLSAQPG